MKKTSILKIISWFQIIGAISGLLLISYLLLGTATINGPTFLIYFVGISLFLFSFYAGVNLLSNGSGKGKILTLINQFLQLFQWQVFGYGLSYSAGGEILMGFSNYKISFNCSIIFSKFNMSLNSYNQFFLGVNLIALVVIIIIIKFW